MIDIGKNGFRFETVANGFKIYARNSDGEWKQIALIIRSTDKNSVVASVYEENNESPVFFKSIMKGNSSPIYKKSCNCEKCNSSNRMIATYNHIQFERWAIDKYGNKLTLEEVEDFFDEPPVVYCEECGATVDEVNDDE